MLLDQAKSLPYGSLNAVEVQPEAADVLETAAKKRSLLLQLQLLLLLFVLGPANFVLYKVVYSVYSERGAFFVTNAINVIYVLIGGVALWWVIREKEVTDEMRQTPQAKFLLLGLLDSLAGFLSAMGASGTSGSTQQLLNQALVPCTMFTSYLFLNKQSSLLQVGGSVLILAGAYVTLFDQELTSKSFLSSIVYASSNIPYAFSFTYKEYAFQHQSINVIYLTQCVSIYQMIICFLMAPLQQIPHLGSDEGMTLRDSWYSLEEGMACFYEKTDECKTKSAFWLLLLYCLVQFSFNVVGLYVVKHFSSVLNAISFAIILPLTVIAFSLPILGPYQEPSFSPFTLIGLGIVLVGFFVWRGDELVRDSSEQLQPHVEAFHERTLNLADL